MKSPLHYTIGSRVRPIPSVVFKVFLCEHGVMQPVIFLPSKIDRLAFDPLEHKTTVLESPTSGKIRLQRIG